ncbi:MAG: response regulator [Candidatus Cloacimonetes bacterium]|nr:response regulator [Candidatus Cloacimonadota bacterium]
MKEETRKKKILIIENDRINRHFLEALLLENGMYETRTANDGVEGLEIFEEFMPDLVLLDIMMPVMDGYETCRRIKKNDRYTPVIFITAIDRNNEEARERMLATGVDDILTKPVQDYIVKMRVRSYLSLKEYYDRMIEVEKKNMALAMAVTANHEMNQPMMIMKGNLDMFLISVEKNKSIDDHQRGYLSKIDNAMKRMSDILDKFKQATTMSFENYTSQSRMIVFNEDDNGDEVGGDGGDDVQP